VPTHAKAESRSHGALTKLRTPLPNKGSAQGERLLEKSLPPGIFA